MDSSFYAAAGATPLIAATPRRTGLDSPPDLPAFRTVPPSKRFSLDDFKLPDGTPMIGPDGLLVPPARSFNMVINAATRVFSYRFDEAMRDNFVNARAMRRDAFLLGLFEERILPTINRRWQIETDDELDPDQKLVRDALTRYVQAIPAFDMFRRALLDGIWFGRAGCQWNSARNAEVDGLWTIQRWDPIHGDSIQFTFDGVPAILLDAMTTGWYASHGATVGPGGDLRPTDRGGTALVLQRPYWRDRFAVHQHMRQKADYFEGELAGSVQGFGLRGQVYWHYVVRTEALTWMLAYMQAVGQMDLLIFNYPQGDAEAKANAEANARKIIGKAAMACPRNPQGTWPAVEQVPMNSEGLKALHDLISEYFDRHIERLFVGQSMSSGADNDSGLGGTGRADFAKACVPVKGSEILTRDGFKAPENVQVGDEVLAYDAETDQCRWTPLLKKSFYEDAPVIRMANKQKHFEAVCTPDHSWAVERTRFASDWREPLPSMTVGPRGALRQADPDRLLVKAHDLKSRQQIILAAPETETETSLLTPTEAAILGWVITDGTIRRVDGRFSGTRYSVAILQSKEENFKAIRKLMTDYTGGLHETVVETKSRTFPMTGRTSLTKPQHMWFLPREYGGRLLKRAGFVDRSSLPKIVTRLSPEARTAMLDAMMAGDGGASGCFTNTDAHVLEAFDILCALNGRATGPLKFKKRDPRYKQCYDKQIKTRRYVTAGLLSTEDAGRCDVWCPTTQYGTWVMRQNGRVMVTGNTKDEIVIYDAVRLDDVITRDVLGPAKRSNFPWAKFPVRFKSVLPDLEAKDKVMNAKTLVELGVPIRKDEVREAGGFRRPEKGDETIGDQPAGAAGGAAPGLPGMPGSGPPGAPGMPGSGPPTQPPAPTPQPSGVPPQAYPRTPPTPPTPPTTAPKPPTPNDAPTSPALGYPGGGNTFLPRFGADRRPPDVAFTRYDAAADPELYHSKGCLLAPLRGEAAMAVLRAGVCIPDEDLAEDGREDDPHVTVRYGFTPAVTPAEVGALLANVGPVRLRLGGAGCFENDEHDVVFLKVESADLHRLNQLTSQLPHTSKHPTYTPHATIAYVKPGLGKKFAAAIPAADLDWTVDALEYSEPTPTLYADDGRWVQMGAQGPADDRHGGTPVFIRDGVIEKGPGKFIGKSPGNLKEKAKQPERSWKEHKADRAAGREKAAADREAEKAKIEADALAALKERLTAAGLGKLAAKVTLTHGRFDLPGRPTPEQRAKFVELGNEVVREFGEKIEALPKLKSGRGLTSDLSEHWTDRHTPEPGTPERAALERDAPTDPEAAADLRLARLEDMHADPTATAGDRMLAAWAARDGKGFSAGWEQAARQAAAAKLSGALGEQPPRSLVDAFMRDPTQDPRALAAAHRLERDRTAAQAAVRAISVGDLFLEPGADAEAAWDRGWAAVSDLRQRAETATTPDEVRQVAEEAEALRAQAERNRQAAEADAEAKEAAEAEARRAAAMPKFQPHADEAKSLRARMAGLQLPRKELTDVENALDDADESIREGQTGVDALGDPIDGASLDRQAAEVGRALARVRQALDRAESRAADVRRQAEAAGGMGWAAGRVGVQDAKGRRSPVPAEVSGPYAVTADGLVHAPTGLKIAGGGAASAKALAAALDRLGFTPALNDFEKASPAVKRQIVQAVRDFEGGRL